MVLTLANILQLPITIFTNIPNLGIICIAPSSGVYSTEPLFLTFNSNGPGHYDYAVPIPDDAADNHPSQSRGTKCYCGRKKECSISACSSDMLGNCRCPCAKKKTCTSSCRCKNCCNNFGTILALELCNIKGKDTATAPRNNHCVAEREPNFWRHAVDEHESVGQTLWAAAHCSHTY